MSVKSFEKKKKREKEVKKKILYRRTATRSAAKKERDKEREQREIRRVSNKLEGKTVKNKDDEEVMNQLSHNYAILEALQKEQEMLTDAQQNTPILNTAGLPVAQEEGAKLSASAGVAFIPNPQPKTTTAIAVGKSIVSSAGTASGDSTTEEKGG